MKRLVIGLFLALVTSQGTLGAEINIFAAASLTDVLNEIARDYQAQTGDKLLFNFGASSLLARQIQEGAPADLFFSADEEKMDMLEKKGLIRKETRQSLLSNSLVVVVASDSSLSMTRIEDLKKAKRIAIAEPRTVPAGIYARKYLEQIGLWSKIVDSLIPTENVRGALAAVESGNVDAGIVYKTDAAISKRVKIAYEVPTKDAPKISYPVAVLKDSKAGDKAVACLNYLSSPSSQQAFEKYGFIVVKTSSEK